MTRLRLWGYVTFGSLAAAFVAAAFVAGYYTRVRVERETGDYALLTEIRDILRAQFIGEMPNDKRLEYAAARGLVAALGDPYTIFVEPAAHELETHDLQGAFGGIGAELRYSETGAIVLAPFPDSPAAKAGLVEGDVLIAVDDTPIEAGMKLEDVSALIRGPVGVPVRLTVARGEQPAREITVVRENIEIPSVTWRLLESQPQIGVIAVSRFSDRTPAETRRAYDDLTRRGMTALVLDLRNNSGGLLEASVQVASGFLDGGVVMYERRKSGDEKAFPAVGDGYAAHLPLVALVNHGTASAAEIVAGAILGRERGPLIGEKTYGKGSVQLVFDLSDGSSVHVTAARWYTPDHRLIDGVGLTPTIEVAAGDGSGDPQLDRAVTYLASNR